MESKKLNGYKIEFYSEEEWYNKVTKTGNIPNWILNAMDAEYAGKVSDIS